MILPATRGDGFHKVKAKPDVILPGGITYGKSLNRWDGRPNFPCSMYSPLSLPLFFLFGDSVFTKYYSMMSFLCFIPRLQINDFLLNKNEFAYYKKLLKNLLH